MKFKEWSDQYGPVFSLKVGASTMIVLNDPRAVHELLNKKGALYVDRPNDEQWDLTGRHEIFVLMHAGDEWKAIRKIMTQLFTPKNLDGKLVQLQESEVNWLMFDLLEKPKDFYESVQRTSSSIASTMIYGQRAPEWKSFWASGLNDVIDATSRAIEPGSYLPINQFPFLKLIPDRWVPSKQFAQQTHRNNTAIFSKARELVEERRKNGDIRESLADHVIDGSIKPDVPLPFSQINSALLGTAHNGASESSAGGSLTSILFLAKYPHFQEKARVELDRVCGSERMPRWSDFDNLPYINCIVKEGQRMRPFLPTGVPYRAKEDAWFDGMLIPKEATVFMPVYALNHTYYTDPATYNPDRYLNHPKHSTEYAISSDYENRDHYAFGAGRRICVGMHLGERTLWRIIAQILWAFKIEQAVDETGQLIELDIHGYTDGIVYAPKPYMVRFISRSEKHADVIRKVASEAKSYFKQWE